MLEILFSDSAAGSLLVAQRGGQGFIGGAVSVIIFHEDGSKPTKKEIRQAQREAEERRAKAWENTQPLGGSREDVLSFSLAFSVGDISRPGCGESRLKALEQLFSIYPDDTKESAARQLFDRAVRNLDTARRRLSAGESARIWYSNRPDELCGMLWFMDQLRRMNLQNADIQLICQPDWEAREDGVVQKNGCGENAPEEWSRYLPLARPAGSGVIAGFSTMWQQLMRQNAPLRAVISGQVVSVGEDFYDPFLLSVLQKEPDTFRQAMVIGKTLGQYPFGMGDGWLTLRMEKWVQAGLLIPLTQPAADDPLYHRTLRKAPGFAGAD